MASQSCLPGVLLLVFPLIHLAGIYIELRGYLLYFKVKLYVKNYRKYTDTARSGPSGNSGANVGQN